MRSYRGILVTLIFAPFSIAVGAPSSAQVPKAICTHNTTGAIALRPKCKANETRLDSRSVLVGPTGPAGAAGAAGAQGPAGEQGPAGAAGADGSLRVYGNGSAGALNVADGGTTSLSTGNTQYTNCTIAAGSTLYVESGTVIRCTGTFTNNGTLGVYGHSEGALCDGILDGLTTYSHQAPVPGIAGSVAQTGELGTNAQTIEGGRGGFGMSAAKAAQMVRVGPVGGGGGGCGDSQGGEGGGTVTIIASGAIVNAGTIDASSGFSGGGGGGGGVVILASKTSVTNNAGSTITVHGGHGAASTSNAGNGGGGGGGIVHFIAPTVTNNGTVDVAGGSAGSGGVAITQNPRLGGGGGGGSGGDGGRGSDVNTNNSMGSAEDGDPGHFITTTADPTSLM